MPAYLLHDITSAKLKFQLYKRRPLLYHVGMCNTKVSDNVEALIKLALDEDFGDGDVTSNYFVPAELKAKALLRPRSQGVLSGVKVAEAVFKAVDPTLKVEVLLHDGEHVSPGAIVMSIEGSARSILGAERTALNFIQRLSGVATMTHKYVKAIAHTTANRMR